MRTAHLSPSEVAAHIRHATPVSTDIVSRCAVRTLRLLCDVAANFDLPYEFFDRMHRLAA